MAALLRKSLRDQRRAFVAWAVGLAGMSLMYAAFYPSVRDSSEALQGYVQNLPDALRDVFGGDFTSPAGYLRSETFSVLGPILFLVFGIGAGARAIAGEEEEGTLDLLLSVPVRRSQVLLDKWTAMTVAMLGLASVLWATVTIVGPVFELEMDVLDLAAACLMLLLIGVTFGTIALALGSLTGRRSLAIGITGAAATAAYIVNILAPVVQVLAPVRSLSPFRWYLDPDPLVHGPSVENIATLTLTTAVALGLAGLAFERRDLRA